MMMLAMLSLVPIETHLEADFVVCLPSDLCGIPTHVKVFRKLTRFDQKSRLVVILQFGVLSHGRHEISGNTSKTAIFPGFCRIECSKDGCHCTALLPLVISGPV